MQVPFFLTQKYSLNALANVAEPEKPLSRAIAVIDSNGFVINRSAAFSNLIRWMNCLSVSPTNARNKR